MLAKVYSVQDVYVGTTHVGPGGGVPVLVVQSVGMVNSGGWSNAELAPWVYVRPPTDGMLDFDFYAIPPAPGTIVTEGFTEVKAGITLAIPNWVKGVRVHASINEIEQLFDPPQVSSEADASSGETRPWPLPWYVELKPVISRKELAHIFKSSAGTQRIAGAATFSVARSGPEGACVALVYGEGSRCEEMKEGECARVNADLRKRGAGFAKWRPGRCAS